MRRTILGLITVAFLVLFHANVSRSRELVETRTVSTVSGPVIGATSGDVHAFKGIPYAASPTGKLRWKAPQSPEAWSEPRECLEFGNICPQIPNGLYRGSREKEQPMNEDCLFLNVWTTSLDETAKRPVMVWIHGGGNTSGSGQQPAYDGSNLASRGVVVVTINYRLGLFGFLAHPLLSDESATGTSGNYGLLDQIQALQWVQQNIARFGGDPDNVTIFGESAGSLNCTALMLSPLAKGLFHRVIAQSATVLMNRRFLTRDSDGTPSAHRSGEVIARNLLDDSEVNLQALRKLSTEDIMKHARKSKSTALLTERTSKYAVGVVIDGYVIPEDPLQLLAEGKFHKVPLIIGLNADEGTIFSQQVRFRTSFGYQLFLKKYFPGHVDELIAVYPGNDGTEATRSFKDVIGDVMILRPSRSFAERAAAAGTPVYFYFFSRTPPYAERSGLGAFHALEIGYVFENLGQNEAYYRNSDTVLSEAMSAYWRAFAEQGVPEVEGLPEWPRYKPEEAKYIEFNEEITTGQQLRQARYELLEKLQSANAEE